MNKIRILFSSLLIVGSFSLMNCAKETNREILTLNHFNLDTVSFPHSVKGYELYSWPNGDGWNYSILTGTNRLKSYDEVTKNPLVVSGNDSLKMLLDLFPGEENIYWIGNGWLERSWQSNYGNLTLPDDKTLNVIKAYCLQKNLVLILNY